MLEVVRDLASGAVPHLGLTLDGVEADCRGAVTFSAAPATGVPVNWPELINSPSVFEV